MIKQKEGDSLGSCADLGVTPEEDEFFEELARRSQPAPAKPAEAIQPYTPSSNSRSHSYPTHRPLGPS